MGIRLYRKPPLERPYLFASWPGIANVGLIAIDTLRSQVQAKALAEIEPWDFFYPKRVIFRGGVLEDLEFPSSKFYYKRLAKRDLIFFVGEEQPSDGGRMYAEGRKAYQMANLVLDVAERFGCQRIYTSGAAVSPTHHALKPRVWAVTTRQDLVREVRGYRNTILMGEVEGRGERGSITGLNGLLLGLAQQRGIEAICLMGEVPDYISAAPFPYPRASQSVLEVLAGLVGVEVDYSALAEMTVQMDGIIGGIYDKLPLEIREKIERRIVDVQPRAEAITEDDEKWIKEHIDELFKEGREGDERAA